MKKGTDIKRQLLVVDKNKRCYTFEVGETH